MSENKETQKQPLTMEVLKEAIGEVVERHISEKMENLKKEIRSMLESSSPKKSPGRPKKEKSTDEDYAPSVDGAVCDIDVLLWDKESYVANIGSAVFRFHCDKFEICASMKSDEMSLSFFEVGGKTIPSVLGSCGNVDDVKFNPALAVNFKYYVEIKRSSPTKDCVPEIRRLVAVKRLKDEG